MVIVCPSCASEYIIDPTRLGADGRTVRCASCRTTWFVAAEPEQPADPSGDAVFDADFSEPASEQGEPRAYGAREAEPDRGAEQLQDAAQKAATDARRQRNMSVSALASARLPRRAAVAFVTLACFALPFLVVGSRARVVEALPETAKLYAGVGLPVNLRGLEFRGMKSELVAVGADIVLVVEGQVANITGRDATVPPIEISVRGAEGQMLYTWTDDPPRTTLGPNESTGFRARLASPPDGARHVLVHFAARSDGAAAVSRIR
jgi:predicted Zn finger-like uncharacterized protein